MKNVFLTLFAIGLAGIAAMAATTAVLNTPVRPAYIGTPKSDAPAAGAESPTSAPDAPTPETPAPSTPSPAPQRDAPAPSAAGPVPPTSAEPEEADENPYGDIPPEELPPDLQYDADSNVSFPTNI